MYICRARYSHVIRCTCFKVQQFNGAIKIKNEPLIMQNCNTLENIFCCRFISQLPLQAVGTGGGILCDNIPGLIGKQRRMCRAHQDAMVSIRQGAKEGVKECQYQFRKHRWNCSTLDRDASVFGKVLLKGNFYVKSLYCIHSVFPM